MSGGGLRVAPEKLRVVLPVLIMGALFWLSSLPGVAPPEMPERYTLFFYWVPPAVQNILHVPVYGLLAWSWHWTLGAWISRSRVVAALAMIITVGYGALDEWHQSFVPGRFSSIIDLALDTVGAALAIWLLTRQSARKGKRESIEDFV